MLKFSIEPWFLWALWLLNGSKLAWQTFQSTQIGNCRGIDVLFLGDLGLTSPVTTYLLEMISMPQFLGDVIAMTGHQSPHPGELPENCPGRFLYTLSQTSLGNPEKDIGIFFFARIFSLGKCWIFQPCLMARGFFSMSAIWRFKLSHGGTPSHHPFVYRIFHS